MKDKMIFILACFLFLLLLFFRLFFFDSQSILKLNKSIHLINIYKADGLEKADDSPILKIDDKDTINLFRKLTVVDSTGGVQVFLYDAEYYVEVFSSSDEVKIYYLLVDSDKNIVSILSKEKSDIIYSLNDRNIKGLTDLLNIGKIKKDN